MKISHLLSRDNSLFKTIRLISSGARRAPAGLVIAEGVRVLEEVNKTSYKVEAVVFSEQFGLTERERALYNSWLSRGVRLCKTTAKLFKSISSVRTPQGALALVNVPANVLTEINPCPNSLILYTCGIQDPGNLGTLIRTAASAGATLFCTTKGTVSARNPKVIRASAGAFFHLPVVENIGLIEFRDYCSSNDIQAYRADTRGEAFYTEIDLQCSCAILLGNEGSGIRGEEWEDFPSIRISTTNAVESLNVAVAGAIILFEASRQRSEMRLL